MNDDVITDLKQFIVATVSQATAELATKEDLEIVKNDVAEIKVSVADLTLKVDAIADALTERLDDHEARLTKLEPQSA